MAYKPKNKREKKLPRAEAQKIIPLEEVQSPRPQSSPLPNPENDSASSEPSEVLETVVQSHAPAPDSLRAKLIDKLRDIASGDDDEPAEDKPKYNYNQKKKQKEEVANLILTIFVVAAAAWPVPDEVKPTKDELGVVANHMTSILARHNLLLGKLSGDALDVVGIIAVGASWYTRVAPELRRLGGPGNGGTRPPTRPQNPPPQSGGQNIQPDEETPSSPIAQADLATGRYLENVLRNPGGEE